MKKIPRFRSEDDERKFWAKHSPLDYVSPKNLQLAVFPNLKPTSRTISIRLPESLVEGIKVGTLSHEHFVPFPPRRAGVQAILGSFASGGE